MKRAAMKLAYRIGRRGTFLLFLAVFDGVWAFQYVVANAATFSGVDILMSPYAWSVIWAIVALVCLIQAFARLDRIAFSLAVTLLSAWSVVNWYAWGITGTLPYGWLTGIFWGCFATMVAVVSFWPEHTRVTIKDFGGAP